MFLILLMILGASAGAPEAAPCLPAAPLAMSCVAAGPFWQGRDDGPANERPKHQVWLQAYYMDLTEVTISAYQKCVRSRKCSGAKPIYSDFNRARQPMVALTWFQARDFCKAVGKHLPTESEWEKAARGPEGELYPWGNEPVSCARAVIEDERGRSCGLPKAGLPRLAHVGRTLEVPARPAYRYGLHDMVGNAWEWVNDWADKDYSGQLDQTVNPRGPCAGADKCSGHKEKVLRGGSWYWDKTYATGTYRRPYVPENQPTSHFGFRCAASLAEAKALVDSGR